MQGYAIPQLQFLTQSVPQPQIVTMLGKGTGPLTSSLVIKDLVYEAKAKTFLKAKDIKKFQCQLRHLP